MIGESLLKEAIKRLNNAVLLLENAVEARIKNESNHRSTEEKLQRISCEQGKLEKELGDCEARAERLEEANKEASYRLVAAMETIRTVLDQ